MAAESHRRAIAAQKAGFFDSEIVPVLAKVKDASGNVKEVMVKLDEGPRADTTAESLGKLKSAFQAGGSTTAGNSCQTSDGAALVLLARRSVAKQMGLPIIRRMRSFAVVGVDPKLMGIGPAYAILAAHWAGKARQKGGGEHHAIPARPRLRRLRLPAGRFSAGIWVGIYHPLGKRERGPHLSHCQGTRASWHS